MKPKFEKFYWMMFYPNGQPHRYSLDFRRRAVTKWATDNYFEDWKTLKKEGYTVRKVEVRLYKEPEDFKYEYDPVNPRV